jgi:hypothetical protein
MPSCVDLDLGSQALCQAGVRIDKNDTFIFFGGNFSGDDIS